MARYGWFEYDDACRNIANYLTGQELAIERRTDVGHRRIYDGCYRDGEITQPIRFCIDLVPPSAIAIRLNYRDAMHRPPPYGYWRRIDAFLVDALLCWPEYLHRGAFNLFTIGGWRSGAWNPTLARRFSGRKGGTLEQLEKYAIAEPYMIPLDTASPLSWKLVDVERPVTEASLRFDFLEPNNIPFLSRSSPVEGFQGAVPFLERQDKAAYIVFSKLEPHSHRGEDPETLLWYTYLDCDIFFRFRSHPTYRLELGTCVDYGFRELLPRRELWTTDPLGKLVPGDRPRPPDNIFSKYSYLSYPVWLRVLHAVGDAWPAWGPRRRVEIGEDVSLPDTYGRVGFIGDYGPTVTHGFTAGMKNSWFELTYVDG